MITFEGPQCLWTTPSKNPSRGKTSQVPQPTCFSQSQAGTLSTQYPAPSFTPGVSHPLSKQFLYSCSNPNTCPPLTCVRPQVRLQVAALAVHLGAAWLPTSVALCPLPRSSTRAPQLPLRQPWRGSRRAVRSWHHLLSHPRQVGQDAGDHEHGGTGWGGDWLVTRVYRFALYTEVEGRHPNTGL